MVIQCNTSAEQQFLARWTSRDSLDPLNEIDWTDPTAFPGPLNISSVVFLWVLIYGRSLHRPTTSQYSTPVYSNTACPQSSCRIPVHYSINIAHNHRFRQSRQAKHSCKWLLGTTICLQTRQWRRYKYYIYHIPSQWLRRSVTHSTKWYWLCEQSPCTSDFVLISRNKPDSRFLEIDQLGLRQSLLDNPLRPWPNISNNIWYDGQSIIIPLNK